MSFIHIYHYKARILYCMIEIVISIWGFSLRSNLPMDDKNQESKYISQWGVGSILSPYFWYIYVLNEKLPNSDFELIAKACFQMASRGLKNVSLLYCVCVCVCVHTLPQWLSSKESTCWAECKSCRRSWFDSWVKKIPWKRKMTTQSIILAWETLWAEEPGKLQSIELQRVGYTWSDLAASASGKESTCQCRRHKRLDLTPGSGKSWRRSGNPHSILAWRIPWIKEAGWLESIGSQRVRYNWSYFSFSLSHT